MTTGDRLQFGGPYGSVPGERDNEGTTAPPSVTWEPFEQAFFQGGETKEIALRAVTFVDPAEGGLRHWAGNVARRARMRLAASNWAALPRRSAFRCVARLENWGLRLVVQAGRALMRLLARAGGLLRRER